MSKYNKNFIKTAQEVRNPEVIYGNLLDIAYICMTQVGITHDEFLLFIEHINELVGYNSQKKSLTALLNKKFDPTYKRIRLENVTRLPLKYKLSVQENALYYKQSLTSHSSKSYKFAHADFANASEDTWDGIVWVPDPVWAFQASEVKNVLEFYIFSGKKFIIKSITAPSKPGFE